MVVMIKGSEMDTFVVNVDVFSGDRKCDLKWVNFSVDKSSCHKAFRKGV